MLIPQINVANTVLGAPYIQLPDSNLIVLEDSASQAVADTLEVKKKPKGALESPVTYEAEDSLIFDVKAQKVYLYSGAKVNYNTIELKANYMEMGMKNNVLYAAPTLDSVGKPIGKPEFKDGDQSFVADTMRYNFKTQRGKIVSAITQEGDGYIHGEQIKKEADNTLYIKNGKYTTCSNPEPHFHIEATKLKIIKNDKIVTGPAYLRVADLPTPLAVPFGYFPNKQGRASGLKLPEYGQSPLFGLYLLNGGYYVGLNDHFDLMLTGDIYSRGSYGLHGITNYNYRYRFNGALNLSYNRFTFDKGFPEERSTNNFFIKWRHSQDSKAKPNSRFSADVNAGSQNNFRNNINSTTTNFLTNTFQSNVSYQYSFPGKPLNLSVNARHSQNNTDSSMTVTFPEGTFTMSRIYPFKRKVRVGDERFYEKIGVNYVLNGKNQVSGKQSEFLDASILSKTQNGLTQTSAISTSIKMLKYFTLTPNVNLTEKWSFKTINKSYDSELNQVMIDTVAGFQRFGDYSSSASLTTKIYGMYQFKKGKVQAIRHVITPNVSFNYRPDYLGNASKVFKEVQIDTAGTMRSYTIFDGSLVGAPTRKQSGVLSFGLINNLEMKVTSKKDTITGIKKVKIFETFNINSSYNFYADSMKLSPFSFVARTQLFDKINIQGDATLNPYAINGNGIAINKFYAAEKGNWTQLGRFTTAALTFSFSLKSKTKTGSSSDAKAVPIGSVDELEYINAHRDEFVDFNQPWSLNFNYNIRYTQNAYKDSRKVSNAMTFSGDVKVTNNWKVGFSSGVDITTFKMTTTSLDIYRDMHCWEMRIRVVPFGRIQSYSIAISPKSSMLQDLRLQRKRP